MARKSWFGNWQLLFTPDMFLPFILGGVAMGVLSNAVFQLLTNLAGGTNQSLLLIAVGSVASLLVAGAFIQRILARRLVTSAIAGKDVPAARRGLILLVSNEETCRQAIEHHRERLKWCWLLYSTQSYDKADKLRNELEQEQVSCEMVKIHDVYDVMESGRKVDGIFAALPEGCGESDVILDFTGMPSVVSVGAVFACQGRDRAIQYTPADYDRQLSATAPLTPFEVAFAPRFDLPPTPPRKVKPSGKRGK